MHQEIANLEQAIQVLHRVNVQQVKNAENLKNQLDQQRQVYELNIQQLEEQKKTLLNGLDETRKRCEEEHQKMLHANQELVNQHGHRQQKENNHKVELSQLVVKGEEDKRKLRNEYEVEFNTNLKKHTESYQRQANNIIEERDGQCKQIDLQLQEKAKEIQQKQELSRSRNADASLNQSLLINEQVEELTQEWKPFHGRNVLASCKTISDNSKLRTEVIKMIYYKQDIVRAQDKLETFTQINKNHLDVWKERTDLCTKQFTLFTQCFDPLLPTYDQVHTSLDSLKQEIKRTESETAVKEEHKQLVVEERKKLQGSLFAHLIQLGQRVLSIVYGSGDDRKT